MKKIMKVILLKSVNRLGRQGEIKEVTFGYARNYLIPRGLADVASPDLVAQIEQRRRKEARQAEIDLRDTERLAALLDGKEFEITKKTSESGSLYSAVNPGEISRLLQAEGYKILPENVISQPIKSIGGHEVVLKLKHGLEVKIMVLVRSGKKEV